MKKRTAKISRKTAETDIKLELTLDGSGAYEIDTGIGFLDHMLTHLSKHGKMDLIVKAKGDLQVDAHHTVEDVAICLGNALTEALGDKKGIARYAKALFRWRMQWRMCRSIFRAGRSACITPSTARTK